MSIESTGDYFRPDSEEMVPPRRRGRPKSPKSKDVFPPNRKAAVLEDKDDNTSQAVEINETALKEYVDKLKEIYKKYPKMPTYDQLFADFVKEYGLEDGSKKHVRKIFGKVLAKSDLIVSAEGGSANEHVADKIVSPEPVNKIIDDKIASQEMVKEEIAPAASSKVFAPNQVVKVKRNGIVSGNWVIKSIDKENKGKFLVKKNIGTATNPEYLTDLLDPKDIMALNSDGREMPDFVKMEEVVAAPEKEEEVRAVEATSTINNESTPVEESLEPMVVPSPEDNPLYEQFEKAFQEAALENLEREEEERKGFFAKFLDTFRKKENGEVKYEKVKHDFKKGDKIKVFYNGRITPGWEITDVLKNGDIYIRNDDTGFYRTFRAKDVIAWNNNPELIKKEVMSAESLDDLIDLVSQSSGIVGTDSKEYYSPEYLAFAIESLREGKSLTNIPRTENLRGKAYELLIAEKISNANGIETLVDVVRGTGGIRGSKEFFTPHELIRSLRSVQNGGSLANVTQTLGLRDRIFQIMSERGAKFDEKTGERIK